MRTRAATAVSALALGLSCSCATLSTGVGYVTGSTQQKEQEEAIARVQAEVMAFADVYVGELLDATSRVPVTSPEQQVEALAFQTRQATAAYEIASGSNPIGDLVDLMIVVTATRVVVDAHLAGGAFGANGALLSKALHGLEQKIWEIAGRVMSKDQTTRLRSFIETWLARNPEIRDVSAIRLADLAALQGGSAGGLGTPTDVLRSLGLDPFAGIDPAVREVQQTRLLAERAFYFAKRWPRILELQTQLLALQLAAQPAPSRALADVTRVSLAAESVARTAEGLPALVDREREAAIRQFLDALSDQEARARALLVEMRRTLDAGSGAAHAVRGALGSLDAILAVTSRPPAPGAPPSHPFDVNEYTRALEQLGRSATELEALLRSANQDAPRIAALIGDAGREVSDRGRALVDYAFGRALALGLALVGSILVASLVYRWAATRIGRS
ncbi:MAG TPA: hypothetical protein VFM53_00425 [Anaeromyxobacteraceae bacterium]|nr:hypothetical protein [Anaeromyxobacteraceae bacterium]